LALIQDPRTPPKIYEKAVESLVARKDAAGLPHLVEALAVKHDFIAGTKPRAVGVVARAIAAMDASALKKGQRREATDALLAQLSSPETSAADLAEIVKALGNIGGGTEIAPLRAFVLTYRADPTLGAKVTVLSAAIDVLLANGGAAERELVAFVASDPRSQRDTAEYARQALEATDRAPEK